MTYTWDLYNIMEQQKKNKKNKNLPKAKKMPMILLNTCLKTTALYPQDAYRMYFTSNHDENSWNGTEYERLGDGAKTFAVFNGNLTRNAIDLYRTGNGFQQTPPFFRKRYHHLERC